MKIIEGYPYSANSESANLADSAFPTTRCIIDKRTNKYLAEVVANDADMQTIVNALNRDVALTEPVLAVVEAVVNNHIDDIESGLEDGTYSSLENQDLEEKKSAHAVLMALLKDSSVPAPLSKPFKTINPLLQSLQTNEAVSIDQFEQIKAFAASVESTLQQSEDHQEARDWFCLDQEGALWILGNHGDMQAADDTAKSIGVNVIWTFDDMTARQWMEVLKHGLANGHSDMPKVSNQS